MKNNKSPGSDGFSAEFFKCFWKKLGHFIVRSINYSYMNGELSNTQKHGLITCLPKGDKPKQFLKNWRPLTLLNTVYKIASGTISNRLKKVLNKIISEDQTGFLSGRYLGENTRLIYDIMHYTEEKHIPGLLLLIDFEKAFDTISWEFIHKCLKIFNFGNSIIKWIKLFQQNIFSNINQCGVLSDKIHIKRGCRQGDPIASQIFIICAEVLSLKIKNNQNISGIKVNQNEIKLSQFADDTTLLLDGSEKSLSAALSDICMFGNISGLKMNFSKTQLIWIGSKKYSKDKLCQEYTLKWGSSKFNLLGIDFDVNLHSIPKLNFDKKISKLKILMNTWNKRKLTPLGRITVFKTLLISQLNHIFISLPIPNNNFIQELNTTMFDFIWDHKPDKIKRKLSVLDYESGGLNIPNISSFICSLKSTWIRRYLQGNGKWKYILDEYVDMSKMINSGLDYFNIIQQKCQNKFWCEVFESVKTININVYQKNKSQLQLPLWYNDKIKIGNKSVFFKDWYNKGIRYIKDLTNNKNEFYNLPEFQTQYNIKTNFITYYGLINAIKKIIDKHDTKNDNNLYPIIPVNIKIFFKNKKGAKDMYKILCSINNIKKPDYITKWNTSFNFNEYQWKKILQLPFMTTSDSKLLWFQTRITHRILGTNWLLHKINNTDKNCTFCNNETETIEHLFWDCQEVQTLLNNFQNALQRYNIDENLINITKINLIFGNFKHKSAIVENTVLLWTKYYIFKTKMNKGNLNIAGLNNFLKYNFKTIKYIYTSNGDFEKFSILWNRWMFYLE